MIVLKLSLFLVWSGDFGQLGLGESMTERKKPFPVGGVLSGVNIVQLACGGMHTVALSDQGMVSYDQLQGSLLTLYSTRKLFLTCRLCKHMAYYVSEKNM